MTVTAETLNSKYNYYSGSRVEGQWMALRFVGKLLSSKMTDEEFDSTVRHISSAGDNISADRKAFNEGFLETLEALMEI
jgi:hypothetical protein